MAARSPTLMEQYAAFANKAADNITTRNQQSSPLLRLPTEIRNQIYGYFFEDLVIDVCPPTSPNRKFSACSYDGKRWSLLNYGANACALMRSCRQLNAECRLLLFQFAVVRVECPEAFLHFLRGLSAAQRSTLAKFYIGGDEVDKCYPFDLKQYTEQISVFFMTLRSACHNRR